MTSASTALAAPVLSRARILGLALLLVAEFGLLGAIFKHFIPFECRANWPRSLCESADDVLISGYGALGAVALFVMLLPGAFSHLAEGQESRLRPLLLNISGVGLALLPVLVLREGTGAAWMAATFFVWALALPMILAGAMFVLAPPSAWRAFLAVHGVALALCLLAGASMPLLALRLQPLWSLDGLSDATFAAVAWVLETVGYAVETWPEEKIIAAGGFSVFIDKPCSGIEGIVLVTLFVTLYLALFRQSLRFPLVLILYPLGLAASAAFNVLRIAILLMIGIEGNPELAVGGFHSHAGWVAFTIVALGIVAMAETVPQLKRKARAVGPSAERVATPPLWQDPVAARILPFAVFMLSALVVSIASQTPDLLYPLRMMAVAIVVVPFWSIYRALPWRLDPLALAAGAFIGVFWIAIPTTGDTAPATGTLAGGALVLWYALRGIGTVVFVPLLEELFFRDYLESRLRRRSGFAWTVGAMLVSATLFAALHSRWAEAFAAALILSAVARRRENITDAILAHAVANAVVFAAAVGAGNFALI
ncbi:exosortase E/protease, VPEID-CTERM system [Maliponia aquimaris]|uniref:Transmembrane exosortase (Exosortase_EpsH) n=1 Tax=Maliponia aquimaris TaxID=1673631 RepID=A0A238L6S9_9RHOB|nr:exosortase E/protease, VPEID-CTERM system [Maliponia aquimaris]SMX50698.1 Transmembrane exosortase (Exosortase_EpsH) [Maliponia aquimaris]